jgi:hypothetical protein
VLSRDELESVHNTLNSFKGDPLHIPGAAMLELWHKSVVGVSGVRKAAEKKRVRDETWVFEAPDAQLERFADAVAVAFLQDSLSKFDAAHLPIRCSNLEIRAALAHAVRECIMAIPYSHLDAHEYSPSCFFAADFSVVFNYDCQMFRDRRYR